jgi:enoyl-CoA hydratase/carnithine racemase
MSIITSTRDGAVVTITLDRVAEGNLLPVDGVRELAAAFRAAGASDAKVILLRGNGADFCRGRDPKADRRVGVELHERSAPRLHRRRNAMLPPPGEPAREIARSFGPIM